jgi:hypothetical protein
VVDSPVESWWTENGFLKEHIRGPMEDREKPVTVALRYRATIFHCDFEHRSQSIWRLAKAGKKASL